MNSLTCSIFVDDKLAESQLVENIRKTTSINVLHVLRNYLELVEKIHQKPTDILFISSKYCEILQNIYQPPFVIIIDNKSYALYCLACCRVFQQVFPYSMLFLQFLLYAASAITTLCSFFTLLLRHRLKVLLSGIL